MYSYNDVSNFNRGINQTGYSKVTYSNPSNHYSVNSTNSQYPVNNTNDDRFFGAGIVAPLLLGGIAGYALRPPYPAPYPYPVPYPVQYPMPYTNYPAYSNNSYNNDFNYYYY